MESKKEIVMYDPRWPFKVDTRMVSEAGIRLDNSKRKLAKTCMRKCYWNHYRGLQSRYGSTALRFGNVYHECMRGYYAGVMQHGWNDQALLMNLGVESAKKQWQYLTEKAVFYDDYRTFENCMELFIGYLATYQDDRNYMEIVNTEQSFEVPFILTEQEYELYPKGLPQITSTGKIDLELRMSGIPWILDFKTTGWVITTVAQQLQKSMQLLHYTWAAEEALGYRPEGALTSVVFASARKNKAGEYGNISTDFKRVPFVCTERDIADWRLSYIKTAVDIYTAWKTNNWPVNYDACYDYNKQCSYMPLCQQPCSIEEVNTDNYIVDFWDVTEESE